MTYKRPARSREGVKKIVRILGSIHQVARLAQVERNNVRFWLKHGVSAERARHLVALVDGQVGLHELRPDLWKAGE